jgi:hypothetical protein
MKNYLNLKTIIGLALICIGLLLPPHIKINNVDNNNIAILNIDKPTETILSIVAPISSVVTDPTDRAKLAIFNQDFANRVKNYDADTQQINDLYSIAASEFFGSSLDNKYKNLDVLLVELIKTCCSGEDNHKLTQEEKDKLSSHFMGLAWSLIQKK